MAGGAVFTARRSKAPVGLSRMKPLDAIGAFRAEGEFYLPFQKRSWHCCTESTIADAAQPTPNVKNE